MIQANSEQRLLRLPEVIRRTSLSRSEIYRQMKEGRFPPGRKLGPKIRVWSSVTIDQFCDDCCVPERELVPPRWLRGSAQSYRS